MPTPLERTPATGELPSTLARSQLLLLGCLLFAGLVAVLLGRMPGLVQVPPVSADVFLRLHHFALKPEPLERLIYMVLVCTTPLLAAAAAWFAAPLRLAHPWGAAIAIGAAALVFIPLIDSDFLALLAGMSGRPAAATRPFLLLAAVVALAFCLLLARRQPQAWPRARRLAVAWLAFGAAALLQLLAWRVVGSASITPQSAWTFHADAVWFVQSQVLAGRTLLADMPSQYGLFAEMLAPLLQLAGASVLALSSVFAVLQLVSLAAAFHALSAVLKSRAALALTGLALVAVTFGTLMLVAGDQDAYYQYWPLRFFWPAVSMPAVLWAARRPTLARCGAVSCLAAVATLWNLDSGMFVAIALGAWLAARAAAALINRDAKPAKVYAAALLLHAVVCPAVFALGLGLLRLKAGQPLHLDWLTLYPTLFSSLGFYMLPMPAPPHPWMSVAAIYIAAILLACGSWRRGHFPPAADFALYAAMLGLGLFVYYQGRSHVGNLLTVCWPAVLLLPVLAEGVVRGCRAQRLPRWWLAAAALAFAPLVLACATLLARLPDFAERAVRQWQTRGVPLDRAVAAELAFVRQHLPPGSTCLILAQRQGLYHAETGTRSPFAGPGWVEMLLTADRDRVQQALQQGQFDCVLAGGAPSTEWPLGWDPSTTLARYDLAQANASGTLFLLRPVAPQHNPERRP